MLREGQDKAGVGGWGGGAVLQVVLGQVSCVITTPGRPGLDEVVQNAPFLSLGEEVEDVGVMSH